MPVSDLNFPEVDFSNAALQVVVCQLRFNTLLRIGVEQPVAFQESLLGSYPKLASIREAAIEFRMDLGGGIIPNANFPAVEALAPEPTRWLFLSSDDAWKVSLGASF